MPISKEGTVQVYNAVAPFYSFFRKKTHKIDDEIMPFVLDVIKPQDNDTILDAGTGPGIYAIKMAERARGADIYGVDLSDTFLNLAKKNASEMGYNHIKFFEGDLESLPFSEDNFDKLICAGVISAVPDRERAARELHRVLKPGGKAVITEPNKGVKPQDRWFLFLLYAMGFLNPKLRGFTAEDMQRYYFNRDSFYALFDQAGFRNVSIFERGGSLCAVCTK